jgi:hypothetical protein
VHPGDVFNNQNLHREEVLIAKSSFFCFRPCQSHLISLENVDKKLLLLRLEEAIGVEAEHIQSLLHKVFTRHEVR